MKTNRKTRPQPSLASLTADEYHQLAEMVCTRTYEDVRQQVNKPRAEGGFDLNISIKPLQVLHARVNASTKSTNNSPPAKNSPSPPTTKSTRAKNALPKKFTTPSCPPLTSS